MTIYFVTLSGEKHRKGQKGMEQLPASVNAGVGVFRRIDDGYRQG